MSKQKVLRNVKRGENNLTSYKGFSSIFFEQLAGSTATDEYHVRNVVLIKRRSPSLNHENKNHAQIQTEINSHLLLYPFFDNT